LKQKLDNSLDVANVAAIIEELLAWTVSDEENILRGPQIKKWQQKCVRVEHKCRQ